jgi:hypothetical protein
MVVDGGLAGELTRGEVAMEVAVGRSPLASREPSLYHLQSSVSDPIFA